MISLNEVFDTYGRKARLFPAFLALIPLFTLLGVYTNILDFQLEHIVWALVSAAALYFVADVARLRGKAVEKKLLQKWGGYPTKRFLRHSDDALDKHTKERYHRAAEALIPSTELPDEQEELNDPKDADDRYESVIRFVLANTRDTSRFSLLFKENINYGFRRNLFGLKPIALLILTVAIAYVVWSAWPKLSAGALPEKTELLLLFFGGLDFLLWVFFVSEKGVLESANDYARQLLASFDVLKCNTE